MSRLHKWIYQKNREELTTFFKHFQKIAEEGKLPNSFYKAMITLTLTPNKDSKKETKKSFMSISLMDIGAKIFNRIQADRIQQRI